MGRSEFREPEKLGSVLGQVNTFSSRKKGNEIERIRNSWAEIVGTPAGENSKPTKISRGTLYIVTRDDPWSSEISMRSSQLLARVKESTGIKGIEKVRIKADRKAFGTINESDIRQGKMNSAAAPGEEGETPGWEGELPGDEKMREALARFLRSSR